MKESLHSGQLWPIRPELIRCLKHEATRSISTLPMDGVLVHRRVTPQHYVQRYPCTHLDGERHCESKVSCPRTHTVSLAMAQTRTTCSRVKCTDHRPLCVPTYYKASLNFRKIWKGKKKKKFCQTGSKNYYKSLKKSHNDNKLLQT